MVLNFFGYVMASITLQDLTVTYNRHPAIHHISGEFQSGTLTAIAGPNGAGKSTLLKAIAGILKPNAGDIVINGAAKHEIAYLPQASEIECNFPLSVFQFVSTGFWQKSGSFGRIDRSMKIRISQALSTVGLIDFSSRSISSLSTGQFQRALFARLILQNAKVILLDEPFNAIDNPTVASLIELIEIWKTEKRTIICVLHDFNQIRNHFPNCLLLARKCIAWGDSKEILAENNLTEANLISESWQKQAIS